MRFFLAALTLAATMFVAVSGAFAEDNKTDPTYYTDRTATEGSQPATSGASARSGGEIYMDLHNENMGQ